MLIFNSRYARIFASLFIGLAFVSLGGVSQIFEERREPSGDLPELVASEEDKLVIERANTLAKSVAATDWLGALSPIAISPFFGMACLTGVATYGPDWLAQRSSLFAEGSPLSNQFLFWAMVVLTVVTSLPRFSKVSKPFALIVDKLETYSVIVILVGMRIFGGISEEPLPEMQTPMLEAAGFATLPLDVVLAIFAGINLLVVGTIKLFFELLIWITPIPTIDALLEMANKSISAGLTALYCFSPFAAAVFDIFLLGACCMVFFWVSRRMHYYLKVFVWPWLWRMLGRQRAFEIGREPMFLANSWNSWPLYTQVQIVGSEATGWKVVGKRFGIFRRTSTLGPTVPRTERELLRDCVIIDDGQNAPLRAYVRKSQDI